MYFKKLELIGFKSFADKTVLNFEPGITAVVGPNGCGKSNIFDAIRWVLGEQSVKALRGSKMEDVIFNGTNTKPSLGFAEVSLSFDNENKFLPIDYKEVVITRKLFRSGESEYSMNKNPVRLKDINELFMGTGITSESYSLVEQGKIDLVLSSKPEDRRMIFDEAAGITLYKSKKKEALRKLEDTDNNLLRVNDIITEVRRQISSVERQAQKARRYQDFFDRLKDLEFKLAAYEMNLLKMQQDELEAKIKEFEGSYQDKSVELDKLQKEFSETQSELDELQSKISEVWSQRLRIEGTIERDTQHAKLNQERIQDNETRVQGLEQQKVGLKERLTQQKQNLERLSQELAAQDGLNLEREQLLKEKRNVLVDIDLKAKGAKVKIQGTQSAILILETQITKIINDIIKINSEASVLEARKRRLQLELAKTKEEHSQIESQLNSAELEYQKNSKEFSGLQESYRTQETQIEEHKNRLSQLNEQIVSLDKEKSVLESQKDFLKELKLKYEQIPQKVKAVIFSPEPNLTIDSGFVGKLKCSVPLKEEYKQMLKPYFNNLDKIHQSGCEIKFIPLNAEEIQAKINNLEGSLKEANSQKDTQEEQLDNLIKSEESLKTKLHDQELNLANCLSNKNSVKEQLDKITSEIALVEDELKETQENLAKLAKTLAQLNTELDIRQKEEKSCKDTVENNQNLIAEISAQNQKILLEITQIETEKISLVDKRQSLSNTVKFLSDTIGQDENNISAMDKEINSLLTKKNELENQIKELEENVRKSNLEIERLDNDLKELEKNKQSYFGLIKARNDEIEKLTDLCEKARVQLHNFSMRTQDFNFRKTSIRERLLNSYKVDIDNIEETLDLALDPTVLNNQINELKTKLDTFGTVNLVAIEEDKELRERLDFLTKQQEDLLTAKDSLHKAITKINRTTRKIFIETFQKIEVEFHNFFRLLFGGGDAKLILIDPEDVLESGIEIICQPPGKKLQNVSLLSGGEKALSAIALIFSIFKIKPSPFCVLDEIDSALDEPNVGRFSSLLKEFTKTSQFIIITHNKKTIANADVMYGITMEESGVSKIVSVKFAETKSDKAQEPKKRSKENEEVNLPVQQAGVGD